MAAEVKASIEVRCGICGHTHYEVVLEWTWLHWEKHDGRCDVCGDTYTVAVEVETV